MPHDGALEVAAVKTRLMAATIAKARIYEGIADDHEIEADSAGGCKPHIILSFAKPIPSARGRGIGVTQAGQPHVFIFTAEAVAADAVTARKLSEEIDNLFTGWTPPTNGNSSEFLGRNGVNAAGGNFNLRSSRWSLPSHWESTINLAKSPPIP